MGKPPSAINDTAQQLSDDADAHMRIARQNRDLAAKKLKLLGELRAFCEANGIPFRVERRQKEQR